MTESNFHGFKALVFWFLLPFIVLALVLGCAIALDASNCEYGYYYITKNTGPGEGFAHDGKCMSAQEKKNFLASLRLNWKVTAECTTGQTSNCHKWRDTPWPAWAEDDARRYEKLEIAVPATKPSTGNPGDDLCLHPSKKRWTQHELPVCPAGHVYDKPKGSGATGGESGALKAPAGWSPPPPDPKAVPTAEPTAVPTAVATAVSCLSHDEYVKAVNAVVATVSKNLGSIDGNARLKELHAQRCR